MGEWRLTYSFTQSSPRRASKRTRITTYFAQYKIADAHTCRRLSRGQYATHGSRPRSGHLHEHRHTLPYTPRHSYFSRTARAFDDNGRMNRGAIIFELAFLILLSLGFVTTPGKAILSLLRPNTWPCEIMLEVQTPVCLFSPILHSCGCNGNVIISMLQAFCFHHDRLT